MLCWCCSEIFQINSAKWASDLHLLFKSSPFDLSKIIEILFYIYLLQRSEFHLNHETSAPVAQLDRVLDYESRGRGFESSPVRQFVYKDQ